MANTVNLGRVQGGGMFYSSATSGTSIAKTTLSPAGLEPLVGDSILFANGDVRTITAKDTNNVTLSDVKANYKGVQGETGPANERLTENDTRNNNEKPDYYIKNYPRAIITEFKNVSKMGLSMSGVYCNVTTCTPWSDATGGLPFQIASSNSANAIFYRGATSETAWGAWQKMVTTTEEYIDAVAVDATGLVKASVDGSTLYLTTV